MEVPRCPERRTLRLLEESTHLLCDDGSNKLSAETEKAIKQRYKAAIIVGGPIAVDSGVEARLENCGIPSVKRIYGETEYETSAQSPTGRPNAE